MDFDPLVPHPLDDEAPGGVVINPHSAYGKELRKWEQHRTDLVPRGTNPGNPYVFRPYPKMLYKAQRQLGGQYVCMPPAPHPYDFAKPEEHQQAILAWESFNRSCTRIVKDESEERLAKGQGWAESPVLALERHEQDERAIGQAAAEAAFTARRMTEKSQAELVEAESSTYQHVTDVTGTPKARRGRPPKALATVAIEGE
jgi:hypothetical protein